MAVNVVHVNFMTVDADGNVLAGKTGTINQVMTANSEHRIVENPNVPNSLGNPTIEAYLNAEDAAGRKVAFMSMNMIVTQS